MGVFDGIPGADKMTDLDATKTAQALGDVLAFFKNDTGDPQGISQGIGNTTLTTNQATTTTTTLGTPASTSDTASPVPRGTPISQPYGAGNDHDAGGHPGVDLAVPVGTSILAAETGTVTHAANDDPSGYGQWVEITAPNGIVTRYGHLSGLNVQMGDKVRAGQPIGNSGGVAGAPGSGNSTGAHLHFEVRSGGSTIDPTPFLAGGYQILGTPGTTGTTTTLDPKAIAAVQLQNVANFLGGKPVVDVNRPTSTTTTTENPQAPTSSAPTGNFASDVLAGIGAPITPENVKFMEAWMRAEGGASHNNPLNTTQGAPGASDYNSVGVKTYTSYDQGVQATIQTLLNGYYGAIIAALKSGQSAQAAASALAASPWGTGSLVQQILGGG